MTALEYLKDKIRIEYESSFICNVSAGVIDRVARNWLDDEHCSEERFKQMSKVLPHAQRILDMASGCGTFVYYGLLHGYEVEGIDPESWKKKLIELKAREKDYPVEWGSRFYQGVGEALPFENDTYDCVSSYQTLEHVQDVKKCLAEMIRVTRSGGCLHLRFPDYRSTFEGHYQLPWLPYFPRPLAKLYLKILGRPLAGLDTLQYVSLPRIKRLLKELDSEGKGLEVVDYAETLYEQALKRKGLPKIPYFIYKSFLFLKYFGRAELSVNLFVHIS